MSLPESRVEADGAEDRGGVVKPDSSRFVVSPPPPDEPELLEKIQAGDQEAFRVLVDRYYGRIFNLFRRILGRHRELARDMTQEAFLRAWRGRGTFIPGSRFSTWLHQIALNYWIQEYRKRTALKRSGFTLSIDAPIGGKDSDFYLDPPSQEVAPQRRVASAELGKAIMAALDDLDDDMRAVVVLRDLEGHSYEEIAAHLQIPIGTVRSRLHRARAQLQGPLMKFL